MKKEILLLIALVSCMQVSAQPIYQDCIKFALNNKKEIAALTLLTAVGIYITYKLISKNSQMDNSSVESERPTVSQPVLITYVQEPEYDSCYTYETEYYPSSTEIYVEPVMHEQDIYEEPVFYQPEEIQHPTVYVAPAPDPEPTSIYHPTYFDRLIERQMDILE